MINKKNLLKYIMVAMVMMLFMLSSSVSFAYLVGYTEETSSCTVTINDEEYEVDIEKSFTNNMNPYEEEVIIYSLSESLLVIIKFALLTIVDSYLL